MWFKPQGLEIYILSLEAVNLLLEAVNKNFVCWWKQLSSTGFAHHLKM